jgi:Holliday junction resolvase-like predicted endonuclease
MNKNSFIGKLGENIGFRYLLNRHYLLINRNYKIGFDEIDIVGRSPSGILIFFEIKTSLRVQLSSRGFSPEDRFSSYKRHKIARACEKFIAFNPHILDEDCGWEIDLLAIQIDLESGRFNLAHYKNV